MTATAVLRALEADMLKRDWPVIVEGKLSGSNSSRVLREVSSGFSTYLWSIFFVVLGCN